MFFEKSLGDYTDDEIRTLDRNDIEDYAIAVREALMSLYDSTLDVLERVKAQNKGNEERILAARFAGAGSTAATIFREPIPENLHMMELEELGEYLRSILSPERLNAIQERKLEFTNEEPDVSVKCPVRLCVEALMNRGLSDIDTIATRLDELEINFRGSPTYENMKEKYKFGKDSGDPTFTVLIDRSKQQSKDSRKIFYSYVSGWKSKMRTRIFVDESPLKGKQSPLEDEKPNKRRHHRKK